MRQEVKGRLKRIFTLVELLVIVAIIAILAAMLLPALNKAVGKGSGAQCIGNMKQIATGMFLYTADYNGRFPGFSYMAKFHGEANPLSVLPNNGYLPKVNDARKKGSPTVCLPTVDLVWGRAAFVGTGHGGSYAWNNHITNAFREGGTTNPDPNICPMDKITRPSSRFIWTDATSNKRVGLKIQNGTSPGLVFVHANSDNFLFVDGHAASVAFASVPVTAAEYQPNYTTKDPKYPYPW